MSYYFIKQKINTIEPSINCSRTDSEAILGLNILTEFIPIIRVLFLWISETKASLLVFVYLKFNLSVYEVSCISQFTLANQGRTWGKPGANLGGKPGANLG